MRQNCRRDFWFLQIFGSLALLSLTAGGLFCTPLQDQGNKPNPSPEIRGVVIEAGTNQPVAHADITLEYYGLRRILPSSPKLTMTIKADFSGAFAFRPADVGDFNVRAKKDGYQELMAMSPTQSSQQNVTLTKAQPVKEVHLMLSRPGQITGVVVDEETRKPIARVQLGALTVIQRGRVLIPRGRVSSQADGAFVFPDLPAGEYVIEVIPAKALTDRVLSKFSNDDLSAVDEDFEHTYWPGGHGADAALPVTLIPGAAVDIGVLPARKISYYRVYVRFPAANCGPGDTIRIGQYQRIQDSEQQPTLAQVPCRGDLLVTGFPLGSHRLIFGLVRAQADAGTPSVPLSAVRPGVPPPPIANADTESASVPLVISDRNLEVTASLERPVFISGVFVVSEGSRLPDLSAVTLSWESGGGKLNVFSGPAKPNADGKFQIPTFLGESRRLIISRLGAGVYIKKILYNGVPVKENVIPLDKGAMSQSLTVVLDDKPAAISGVVIKDDKPIGRALVIWAMWPLPEEDLLGVGIAHARCDDNGRFQVGGLAPGEYRMVAVAFGSEDRPLEALRRALAASPKVEVAVSAFQNVKLELSELR
ncbi:MAG TPA: carboxypeptidase-like regulatory domain-containing protein [Bryobacteraceae bacterium]|nr:carboxypeptidase-like regulatory domain-containing protein [Bryobacteraceae bacterium]